MADAITIKALQDASLDAKSLEEVVNGNEAKQVTTRKGETYPSVKKAIKTMFENGGLPATPFATKALMTASALVDGKYAMVTDETENNGLYVKTTGVWVKSKYDLLLRSEFNSVLDTANVNGFAFAVMDSVGNVSLGVNNSGGLEAVSLDIEGGTIFGVDSGKSFSFDDDSGNTAAYISKDGTSVFGRVSADYAVVDSLYVGELTYGKANDISYDGADTVGEVRGYTAELNGVCSYGQSLAVGSTAVPILSTEQTNNNLMFVGGVRTSDAGSNQSARYGSLAPLVEQQYGSGSTVLGETPISGMADMIVDLAKSDLNLSSEQIGYQILGSAPGLSATPITGLLPNRQPYLNLKDDITFGKLRADELGKTYEYQATTWMQGEADYSAGRAKDGYKTYLNSIIDGILKDAKEITGQSHNPKFITYQTGSHLRYAKSVGVESAYRAEIAQAQLEASNERQDTHLACPMYQLDYTGTEKVNQVHITAEDSRMVGAYFGIVYKKTVIEGENWKPLSPSNIYKSGKSVYVKLHVPRPPLVIDTDWVLENTNYGFRVFNGASQISITNISLIHGDTIKITCSNTVPDGFTVDYALFSNHPTKETGREFGARGNIRDSQGDDYTMSKYGITRKLHNWLVMFKHTEEV